MAFDAIIGSLSHAWEMGGFRNKEDLSEITFGCVKELDNAGILKGGPSEEERELGKAISTIQEGLEKMRTGEVRLDASEDDAYEMAVYLAGCLEEAKILNTAGGRKSDGFAELLESFEDELVDGQCLDRVEMVHGMIERLQQWKREQDRKARAK